MNFPRDRITNEHQGFGFVEFKVEEDSDYSMGVMNQIKLFGKPIKINKASLEKKTADVGANLFVGNLSEEVDEKKLRDVFQAFGIVITTKVMRDPETGGSKQFGFVGYDSFDASDFAIERMNGQYLDGK